MKKNRFLKIAACLAVLCLLTTCAIGTTLARYTTSGSTQDQARVAKWGVSLEIAGDRMFDNQYKTDATQAYSGTVSVTSSAEDNVVAPGTNCANGYYVNDEGEVTSDGNGLVFVIKGTPEVAVNIVIEFNFTNDIYLAAGEYANETTEDPDDTFVLADDYYPVVFTLKQVADYQGTLAEPVVIKSGNLAAIKEALDLYNTTANYAPNSVLDSTFELSWEWAIDGNDAADTYLGNRMADGATGTWSTQLDYAINITVSQID